MLSFFFLFVAGEMLGNRAIVTDADKCTNTGFYLTDKSAVGLPPLVLEAPLIVFAINKVDAVQIVVHNDFLYVRLYWHGRFHTWLKFEKIG